MKTFYRDNKYVFTTFFCASTIVLMVFIKMGLSPFGDRQIMVIDSWHQYFPALLSLHRKIRSGESLYYTWLSGGGTNYLTFIGYYASSPINLLSLLFPESLLQEYFWMATLLKIALAGSFFSYYLKKIFKVNDLSLVIFGLTYSFCGFLTGYYWNIMWLDVVALLPLVVLGMHQVIFESKYRLYIIVLASVMINNFYIGIFVCEFVAIYFFVTYFDGNKDYDLRHFVNKVKAIVLASVLGLLASAVFLFPIIAGMTKAYGHSSANPTQLETYYSLLDIINNLLINVTPTVIDGLPNISSSMLVFTLVIIFFSTNHVSLKKKVIYGVLILFLLLSLNVNYLNFVWHGLHFPNQVPYRFSFLLSFVLITMAYHVYQSIDLLELKQLKWVLVGLLGYFIFAEKFYTSLFDFKVFYSALIISAVYIVIIIGRVSNRINKTVLITLLLILIIFESLITLNNSTKLAGTTGREEYNIEAEAVDLAMDYIESTDHQVHRIEMAPRYSTNDALSYGYRGIVQFASTANASFARYTQYMGMPSDAGSNTIAYEPNTPALNGLFGIGYLLSKFNHIPMPNEGYEAVFNEGNITVLKNLYALPFMYHVNRQITELSKDIISPFERQLRFYNLATGKSRQFFAPIPVADEQYQNMKIGNKEGARFHYENIDPTQGASSKISYTINQKDQYYLYMLNQTPTMTLTIGDKTSVVKTARGMVVDMGVLEPSTIIEVSFEVMAAKSGYFDLEIVSFDEVMFGEIAEEIKAQGVDIHTFTDTLITGVIETVEEGLVYTSIPYDKGWKIKVNNETVEPWGYKSGVIAIPVKPGVNYLEMSYTPEGFILGLMTTLFAIIVIIVMPIFKRKNLKSKETT